MRTRIALFFTFLFPLIFLFVYAGLIAHGNPEAVAYMFGPVVTLNIMGSGFWGLGMQSVVQRERGSLRRYRLAPVGPGTILMSNLLANYLLELPTIALLLFCSCVFFHMPVKVGWITLLFLVTVGTFAFSGFGLTIASVANTMQEAQIYNNLTWLTLLFLSGVTFPLPLLPRWIQRLAMFFPSTYLVSSFQAVTVQAHSVFEHWPEMLVLIISGIFGLLFALKLFRWEKEERISTRGRVWSLVFLIPFLLMGLWMNTRANPTAAWAMTYSLMSQSALGNERASPNNGNLIENFESSQASENLLKRWEVSTTSNAAGHSVAELSLLAPGASGTRYALRLRGRLAPAPGPEEGFVSARYEFEAPSKARDSKGIQFEVRGDSRVYQIKLQPVASSSPLLAAISFVPGPEWQTVRLPVGTLAHPPGDGSVPVSWVLEIVVAGPPGDFTLDIDEIRFY